MSGSKSNTKKTTNNSGVNSSTVQSTDQFVDVLYQKLGDQWFAFSLIDDEVFMSPVSSDQIAEIKTEGTAVSNIRVSHTEIDNEAA